MLIIGWCLILGLSLGRWSGIGTALRLIAIEDPTHESTDAITDFVTPLIKIVPAVWAALLAIIARLSVALLRRTGGRKRLNADKDGQDQAVP